MTDRSTDGADGAPRVVHDPVDLRAACDDARAAGRRVGLVPTMGALHDGHLSLARAARRRGADFIVVTIFVNPLQFGAGEDLDRYPRTLPDDVDACRRASVDLVFAPAVDAMYPPGFQTAVEVTGPLVDLHEGAHRPGHFRGVTTVVAKLFTMVGPSVAVFGKKDYQQWRVLTRMARDLAFPVDVVGEPTVREPDGLALSSRNRYLAPADRRRALAIHRGLSAADRAWRGGERDAGALTALATDEIEPAFDRVDYITLADAETLVPRAGQVPDDAPAALLVAAHLGGTRLIDNRVLGDDGDAPHSG